MTKTLRFQSWREPRHRVRPSSRRVAHVVGVVSFWTGVPVERITGTCRKDDAVMARAEVVRALIYNDPGRYSFPGIGKAINRDHATVIYHARDDAFRQKKSMQATLWRATRGARP